MSEKRLHISNNLSKRDAGLVHFDLRNREEFKGTSEFAIIDKYVLELGHHKCEKWLEIKRPDAERLLTSILHKDMAYNYECMEISLARAAARSFFDQFAPTAKFFTNAEWRTGSGGLVEVNSWNNITDATFDAGIVALDDLNIGIVWIEDED